MFTITKESDLLSVQRIKILLYGTPGVGKTTLGFSAKNPILLDTDEGAHRAMFHKDHIRITNWQEISKNMTAFFDAIKQYDTVVIDTINKLLRLMLADIKVRNTKTKDGRQLYGILLEEATNFLSLIKSTGKDVVMIAHEEEKEAANGDASIRAQITGKTAGLIMEESDVVGRMFFKDKNRVIDFTPSETYFTKDAGLGLYVVPANEENVMETIISTAKEEFIARSKRRAERREEAMLIIEQIKTASDVNKLNEMLSKLKTAPESLKSLYRGHVVNKANELGATLQGGKYVQSVSISA